MSIRQDEMYVEYEMYWLEVSKINHQIWSLEITWKI